MTDRDACMTETRGGITCRPSRPACRADYQVNVFPSANAVVRSEICPAGTVIPSAAVTLPSGSLNVLPLYAVIKFVIVTAPSPWLKSIDPVVSCDPMTNVVIVPVEL